MSALKWQGWLVALVFVAGLLVFAPLGLYVWAGGRPAARSAEAAPDDVRITGCRIDPTSRRVVASVEAVNGFPEQGAYVVTVEFREQPPAARDGSAGPAARPGSRNGSAGPAAPGSPNGAGPAVRPGSPDGGAGPAVPGSPDVRGPQALARIPGVPPAGTEWGEVVGPVWPPAVIPWCGIAAADFAPDPPFARSLGLRPRPRASNAGEAGFAAARHL
ncbi:hypothetical protein [Streptomyces sp. NBC_01244]|uniref:hypothetical protein n=1 Tax=Streptomyces sp. NBC_01244 TaxID=2903797 RepID=UPI002E0EC7D8|nr:hypothetical protein OG247_27085 [Streptomyces sp. NBC_01244]